MSKWKQHYDEVFQLYHVSEKNCDGIEFVPRSVDKDRAMEGENWRTKRICVATTVQGALNAIGYKDYDCIGKQLFVHVPENLEQLFKKDKIYKPSLKQVPDQEVNGEFWLKAKAKMKCVGKIQVTGLEDTVDNDKYMYYCLGTRCWIDNVQYCILKNFSMK